MGRKNLFLKRKIRFYAKLLGICTCKRFNCVKFNITICETCDFWTINVLKSQTNSFCKFVVRKQRENIKITLQK